MAYLVIRARFGQRPRGTVCGEVARGRTLFERFHDFAPPAIFRQSCQRTIPPVLVKLGRLRGLIYTSDKGSCGRPRTYIHFMQNEPLLACNPEGTQLHIFGGCYRVTARGIEG